MALKSYAGTVGPPKYYMGRPGPVKEPRFLATPTPNALVIKGSEPTTVDDIDPALPYKGPQTMEIMVYSLLWVMQDFTISRSFVGFGTTGILQNL